MYFLAVDLSPTFLNTGATDEIFQPSGKQDSFRYLLNISASCVNMALKPSIFICWWRSLLVATSKFSLFTTRWKNNWKQSRKHLFLYPQGGRSGLRKPKEKASTLITATTSIYLPKPVSTNLTINSDSVITNPIGKDGVRGWSV